MLERESIVSQTDYYSNRRWAWLSVNRRHKTPVPPSLFHIWWWFVMRSMSWVNSVLRQFLTNGPSSPLHWCVLNVSSLLLFSFTICNSRTPFLSNISRWKGNINLCLWEIRTSDSFDCKRDFIIGTHKGNLINRNPGQKKSSNRRWAWLSVNRRHKTPVPPSLFHIWWWFVIVTVPEVRSQESIRLFTQRDNKWMNRCWVLMSSR